MNSIDPQSPVGQPNNTTSQTDSPDRSNRADKDRAPAFSQVLAKKRQPLAGAEKAKPGKGELPDAMDMGLMPAKNTFDQPPDVAAAKISHPVEIPPQLEHLVREIEVGVNAAGRQQVHIELNSNVLKGLVIRVERHDNGVGIQFQSASEDVSRLLSSNLEVLTQGLANRGVEVDGIQVISPGASSTRGGADSKGRPYPGSQQGGRR